MTVTGSKVQKAVYEKIKGLGWGYVIQNQISPNFRFPEVGISTLVRGLCVLTFLVASAFVVDNMIVSLAVIINYFEKL